MGVIWFAVNRETKQAYELGKGAWFELADNPATLDARIVSDPSRAKLLPIISGKVIVRGYWDEKTANDKAYHAQIAEALEALGSPLEIINDCSYCYDYPEDFDDDFEPTSFDGCKIIGTRYKSVG